MFLGDPHNFGRRVELRGGVIHKPRTVVWEWLMLSKASPLRRFLGREFDFLPSLAIDRRRGLVERLQLQPLRGRQDELAAIVGKTLALWAWLGVADLHWENMALGRDGEGRIVFGPLDIEMMFGDMRLPTETKLIPEADPEYGEELRRAAGVRRALAHLGTPIRGPHLVAIVMAYRATLEFLDHHTKTIARLVSPFDDAPIRLLLRATSDYGKDPVPWPPLLDCESEQMARGDVPYFFRLRGKRGIRYFTDARLRTVGFAAAPTEPLLPRSLRSPSRRVLREQGTLAVIGAFDHPSLTGKHGPITLGKRIVFEDLACPRNLRAIVGSVY
ncbi:MAG TPA: hypothetical protein VGH87_21240 [Polyangiaceae bacterium]